MTEARGELFARRARSKAKRTPPFSEEALRIAEEACIRFSHHLDDWSISEPFADAASNPPIPFEVCEGAGLPYRSKVSVPLGSYRDLSCRGFDIVQEVGELIGVQAALEIQMAVRSSPVRLGRLCINTLVALPDEEDRIRPTLYYRIFSESSPYVTSVQKPVTVPSDQILSIDWPSLPADRIASEEPPNHPIYCTVER